MDHLPQDPNMLASSINMMLRDDMYENIEDLCADFGVSVSDITSKLSSAGYIYDPNQKKFR